MKNGNEPDRGKGQRRSVVALLVLGVMSLVGAGILGISDNPPGILLCYLGVFGIMLALVHRWRRSKSFLMLFGGSLIGFVVLALLHNLLHAVGHAGSGAQDWITLVAEVSSGASFLVAVLLCPAGVLIGFVGFIVTRHREKRLSGS
jgi:hypothetical protein